MTGQASGSVRKGSMIKVIRDHGHGVSIAVAAVIWLDFPFLYYLAVVAASGLVVIPLCVIILACLVLLIL